MTKSTITKERVVALIAEHSYDSALVDALEHLLAAMDSEPVEVPLDYLQGHKDGLEWAAQLAESNHHETGDWLYDDPIELAKAIRKGPDMPPAQPVADSYPVIVVGDDGGDALSYRRLIQYFEPGTKLYRHAQPASVSITEAQVAALEEEEKSFHDAIRKCIASLRYHHKRAEAHSTGYKGSTLEDDTLKSIDFLKRNITATMLSGGKS